MRRLSERHLLASFQLALAGALLHCSAPVESSGDADEEEPEVPGFVGTLPGTGGTPTGPNGTSTGPNGTPTGPNGTSTSPGSMPSAPGGNPSEGNPPQGTPVAPGGDMTAGGNAAPATPAQPGAPDTPTDETAPATPGAPVPAPPPTSFVERGAWRGFAVPQSVVAGTTITPTSFADRQPGQPFCLSGTVAPDPAFQGEASIGFTINQAATSDVPGQAAPALTAVPTGNGIALSFSRSIGSVLRIQLQPPNEATPYCYEIPEASGVAFAPYSAFNTACWDGSGEAYARQAIEAVKFQVPGDDQLATPFGFCINGFVDGQNEASAPNDIQSGGTPITGSISGQLDRAKVLGPNGESYVVQNNAWGATSSDGSQVIEYSGNGFTITRQAAPPNGNVPVSFPSIFIGSNGYRGPTGYYSTALDDNLPRRISDIQSVQTRFRHNGGNGDYNVTYDVWFASNPPQGDYETAQAAFLMVWLYKPAGRNAIGFGGNAPTVTVDGRTWRLYVGDRNEGSDGTGGNAPVISYVNEGAPIFDYDFDLMDFIRDAIARSQAGQLNGANFNANLFLTDVFGGFEIWSGGQGLRIDEFSAVVR